MSRLRSTRTDMGVNKASATLLSIVCLSITLTPAALHAETLPPRNECAADPAYFSFEQQLRAATHAKDAERLLALVVPDIKSSFGGEDGIEEFRAHWRLSDGAASPIWAELERILSFGCAQEQSYAALPYMFVRLPDHFDAFETYIATGTNIVMREGPGRDTRAIARLDWDIMTQVRDGEVSSADWMKVSSSTNHNVGYVHRSLLRSPIDYRLIVQPVDGALRITAFVAGD